MDLEVLVVDMEAGVAACEVEVVESDIDVLCFWVAFVGFGLGVVGLGLGVVGFDPRPSRKDSFSCSGRAIHFFKMILFNRPRCNRIMLNLKKWQKKESYVL